MAIRDTQRGRDDDNTAQDQWTETAQPEDSDETEEDGRRRGRQLARVGDRPAPARRRVEFGAVFNPSGAIPVGRLRLARSWREAGSTYQAIYAYTEVLARYPGTGAASAAVEELLDMAESLARQGRYYAALGIFNKLEQLC